MLTSKTAMPETESVPVPVTVSAETYQPFAPVVPFCCKAEVGTDASYFQSRLPDVVRPEVELTVKTAAPVPSGRATMQLAPQLNDCPAVPVIVRGKPCGSEAVILSRAFWTHQP